MLASDATDEVEDITHWEQDKAAKSPCEVGQEKPSPSASEPISCERAG